MITTRLLVALFSFTTVKRNILYILTKNSLRRILNEVQYKPYNTTDTIMETEQNTFGAN